MSPRDIVTFVTFLKFLAGAEQDMLELFCEKCSDCHGADLCLHRTDFHRADVLLQRSECHREDLCVLHDIVLDVVAMSRKCCSRLLLHLPFLRPNFGFVSGIIEQQCLFRRI